METTTAAATAPTSTTRSAGVFTLHVMVDEALQHDSLLRFDLSDVAVPPSNTFDAVKLGGPVNLCGTGDDDAHFGTVADRSSANCPNTILARRLVFRYAVFGHDHAHTPGSSGKAEQPGNDLVVTLGGWGDAVITAAGGRRAVEAGTLMHELGHNLNLGHGGGDGWNCKPNYFSVMSYSFQVLNTDPDRPLDYSSEELDALDEEDLDESAGVGGPAGRLAFYGVDGDLRSAAADDAIDWNDDGDAEDMEVESDINGVNAISGCWPLDDAGDPTQPKTLLRGFDDWSNLVYNFRLSADFVDGVPRTTVPPEDELTDVDVLAAALELNEPPVADAGPDLLVDCVGLDGTPVTLDGTASSDAEGRPLAFLWTGPFPEGGGTVGGSQPTVTMPLGTSTITLVVDDGLVDSVPDTVEVTVALGADGFDPPLAALVREGEVPPLPTRAFNRQRTLPLRLRLHCAERLLTDDDVAAPRIVALAREGDPPLDLGGVDLNAGRSNGDDLVFRYDDDGSWIFNLSTRDLAPGIWAITLRLADGERWVGAWTLR